MADRINRPAIKHKNRVLLPIYEPKNGTYIESKYNALAFYSVNIFNKVVQLLGAYLVHEVTLFNKLLK